MIELVIDTREQKLIQVLESTMVPYRVEQLKHGDVQIVDEDDIIFILERKTLVDLKASISDGRYRNQKMSVMELCGGPTKLYYIIEGDFAWSICDEGLKGALINTMLRDKIGVFRTSTVQDTAQLIQSIFHRVSKDPSKYINIKAEISSDSQVIVDRSVSPFIAMLCQVPGISKKGAQAISSIYCDMESLYKALVNLEPKERLRTLTQITVNNRRISSKAIQNLIDVLFSPKN